MVTDYLNPWTYIDHLELIFTKVSRYLYPLSRYFLLDNKTSETTLNTYLVSLKKNIESCLKIGSVALSMKSGYIFGILCWKNYFYLFDSHSKDDKGNISQNGTFILVKFETLDDLEDYIKLK